MNSVLIQPHGATFDNYIHMLKQQKRGRQQQHYNFGGNNSGHSPTKHSIEGDFNLNNTYGKIPHRRPAARDGHTGVIFEGNLVIFGGDRHHMPFNDIFMLDIESELKTRNWY